MTFILIHGSFHDGEAWSEVAAQLRSQGHHVHTPTVAGHGHGARVDTTHDLAAQSVVEYIESNELTQFVLVGHSSGGITICKVAEKVSTRVRRMVFFSAFVPASGESLLDNMPPEARALFGALAAQSEDNTVSLPFPVWRELFMNDAPHDLASATWTRLSPDPYGKATEPVDLTTFYELSIPRSYLLASEDTALPPGSWWWHPRMSSRLDPYRFHQMPGGHELMFTNPQALANKLIEAGQD